MSETTKVRRPQGTGSLFRWKGKGPWWTKVYCNGKPILESTETTNRRAAERELKKRQHLAESDDAYAPNRFKKVTVKGLFDDLVVEYRNNHSKSIGHLELRWRLHLAPVFGDMLAAQVKRSDVASYIDARNKEGAAIASINRELAILRRAFSQALGEKVKTAPRIKMLKENNTRTGFLESKDRDSLAAACGRVGLWMRALFELGVTYGWRHGELLGLRVRQVNLITGTVRLEPGTTKNGEGREVAMTPVVRTLLAQCVRGKVPGDCVFTRASGRPVCSFRNAWADVCAEAGVGKFICPSCSLPVDEARRCVACRRTWRRNELKYSGLIFHDLRRSAAKDLRNAGVAEVVIMKIGGWRTREVFKRYSIVSQDDIADAMLKLGRQRETEASEAEKPDVWAEKRVESAVGGGSGLDAAATAPLRN